MSTTQQHSQPASGPQARSTQQTHGRRPAWAVGGGLGILTGGVLLTTATVLEAGLPGDATGSALTLFTVFLFGAAIAHAVAMLPFALGSTGANGVCGSRMLGTVALLCFGAVFLVNEVTYWVLSYGGGGWQSSWILTAFGVAQVLLLLTASTVIVVDGVATGAARWAFPAVTAAAVVAGVVVTTASDPGLVWGSLLFSTCTQVVAGAVLMTGRERTPALAAR